MVNETDLIATIEALSRRVAMLERICLSGPQAALMQATPNNKSTVGLVFRGVVQAVADDRGLDPAAIMDMSRRPNDVCEARWMVWQQLVFVHKWSRAKVARRFCCDHTTVMHGLARAENLWGPIKATPPELTGGVVMKDRIV